MKTPETGSEFIRETDKLMLRKKWAAKGDPLIFISSDPIRRRGIANRIVIHKVGESLE